MGAEHSRVQSTHATSNQHGVGPSPVSWKHLAFGFQYSATDVAVWPQCVPLVLWFTEQDALVLHQRLLRRPRTRFLTLHEFRTWLSNDVAGQASVLHPASLPVVPDDIMTPPSLLLTHSGNPKPQTSALLVLDLYVEHVFTTFARGSGKLYAMEFLAAMVVGSRAIWSIDHKCRVLLTLFQDPANNRTAQLARPKEPIFKEADLAQLFLCVMSGASKLTVGVHALWQRHGLNVSRLARQFAADGIQFGLSQRTDTNEPARSTKIAVAASQVRSYIASTPAFHRFLALFSGEEMRNPFTFGVTRSPSDGLFLPPNYRPGIDTQRAQYETLLKQYVSFEGRGTRRRESAAMLIQSTWRRRCSRGLLERKRVVHQRQRHASAALLQHFLRQCQFAKVLEQHAEAEAHALNGGVFLAGMGPCVPHAEGHGTPSPLKLVDAFKLLNVKITDVAMARTCALAVQSDRQTLFVWGRCLPRVYLDALGAQASLIDDTEALHAAVKLTQSTPGRLAFRFPAPTRVASIACGLSHAVVATDDGNVHSWGFNDHGQLGHGSAATLQARTNGRVQYSRYYDERDGREYEFVPQPTKLVYFQGAPQQQADPIPIDTVVCGDYYSMALSRDGDVFTWGEASEGQLGHGDAHSSFQVAFVDRHMLNSAYTYLPEPEPVLALSDQRVVQIACKKNHSVALTAEGRVFEWGNWGKRLGHDREHAFSPVEMNARMVTPLRLRQLSVGDHHTVAEGSSVWLTIPGRVDGLSSETRVYLACSPVWSCNQDVIDNEYADTKWDCVVLDCDVDDIEIDVDSGQDEAQTATDSTREEHISLEPSGDRPTLWAKRVEPFRLREPLQVATYDAKFAHVFHCFRSLTRKFTLEKLLMLWFHGHVQNKLVAMPRGKPSGVYLQILLPRDETETLRVRQQEAELEAPHAASLPPMVEFPVVGAGNVSLTTLTKTGFATHFFHSFMRERLAALPRRVRKVMPMEFMEPSSIYILTINESSFESSDSLGADDWDDGEDPMARFFTRSMTPDGKQQFEWSDLVVETITRRVLAAQETGALAVLVVLDLLDADPFELRLAADSGVYVPVLMAKRATAATRTPDQLPVTTTLGDVLEQFITSQAFDENDDVDQPPAMPPAWMVRCFERVDTTPARIRTALANGAAGVVLFQDAQSIEVDGETFGAPVFLDSVSSTTSTTKLVAMVSHSDGLALRAASRLAPANRAMPFVMSESPCELLVEKLSIEIRPGGTIYAWGNAQNGRLGLGNPTNQDGPFRDGYEALTDSAYRYVDRPTPVVALAGHEMTQLVCGAAHNVAITTDGRVFTWGKGTRGELANARTKDQAVRRARDQWVPRLLQHLRYDRIVAAAANDSATALLSELVDPEVYMERRREVAQLRNTARKSLV